MARGLRRRGGVVVEEFGLEEKLGLEEEGGQEQKRNEDILSANTRNNRPKKSNGP